MIQSATLSKSPSPPDRNVDSRRSDAVGAFQQSFAAFLDAREPDDAPPVAADPGNDDPAADGNPLPDGAAPTLAWLAQLMPPTTDTPPAPTTPASPQPIATQPIATIPPVAIALTTPPVVLATIETPPATDPIPAPAMADAVSTESDDTPLPEPKTDVFALPAVPDPAPRGAAPAAEVFGAAIHAATGKDDDAVPRRELADAGQPSIGAVGLEPQRHAVLATGDVQQAPLDTRHDNFPHQMIDRIEQLRDDANANDTRIRLIPDALGRIDVTMRRDGDAVHVHFSAEQAATRALLNDAQPQLADIAASRGLNLGQTSVGSDGANQQQHQTRTPTWQPQATSTAVAADPITNDIRIA